MAGCSPRSSGWASGCGATAGAFRSSGATEPAGPRPPPIGDIDLLSNPHVHEHSDFAVFIHEQQMDFRQERFVTTEDRSLAPDVHLHLPRTTVVHKHRHKVTWGYFFETLGMRLDRECFVDADGNSYCNDGTNSLKFFVNGVQVDDLAPYLIHDLDRVMLSYGPESPEALQAQLDAVTDEACILSGRCVDRIPGDEEAEPCSFSGDGGVCH